MLWTRMSCVHMKISERSSSGSPSIAANALEGGAMGRVSDMWMSLDDTGVLSALRLWGRMGTYVRPTVACIERQAAKLVSMKWHAVYN